MGHYAGVRVPSELQNFTWGDIFWDQSRIRIRDAKHSFRGKPVTRITLGGSDFGCFKDAPKAAEDFRIPLSEESEHLGIRK